MLAVRGWARAVAVVALGGLGGVVGGPLLPASALLCGSLCPSANTPMLVSLAQPVGQAAITSGAATAAGSSVAPVAALPVASAAATAGVGSSVWGSAVGRIAVLLGGVGAWSLIAPGASDPGLPSGSGSGALTATQDAGASNAVGSASGTAEWQPDGSLVVTGSYTKSAGAYAMRAYLRGCSTAATCTDYLARSDYSSVVGSHTFTAPMVVTAATAANYAYIRFGVGYCTTNCAGGSVLVGGTVTHTAIEVGAPMGEPNRYVQQTVTCKSASGEVTTVESSGTASIWPPGGAVPVAGLMCPSGSRAVGVAAKIVTAGGPDVVVAGGTPGAVDPSLDALTAGIPDVCATTGAECILRLERITPEGTWEQTNGMESPGWASDPGVMAGEAGLALGDAPKTVGTYRCTYGVEGDLVAAPIAACGIYAPETGGLELPTEGGATQPGQNDPSGDCQFGWTDLLTGAILIRGGKCLLVWAFIPEGGVQPRMEAAKAQWTGSPIGSWVGTMVAIPGNAAGELTSGSGCSGPVWQLPLGGREYRFAPLDACDEPMATIATGVKLLVSALLLVAGWRTMTRLVTSSLSLPGAPGAGGGVA